MTAGGHLPYAGSPRDVESPRDAGSPFSPSEPGLSADGLRSWAKEPHWVERVLPLLGEAVVRGSAFPCVVPGHPAGCRGSVRFDGGPKGHRVWRYHCPERWRSLAEARACVVAEYELEPLPSATQRLWYDRLALEAGLIKSSIRPLRPPLPPTAADLARVARVSLSTVDRVHAGFGLALWVRSLRDATVSAFLFVPVFAGPWSGVSVAMAKKARQVLAQAGAIHAVGEHQVGESRYPGKLWSLGGGGERP